MIKTLPAPRIIDPSSVPALRWGVIGPGAIAEMFVGTIHKHTIQRVHAVASRTPGRAQEFAAKFGIPQVFDSYDQLVTADIDAVYIASYQGDHFEHAMLALAAGKHVLVEKPITYLPDEAEKLLATAKKSGLLAIEAMWTRYLPQSDIIRQLLASGDLGAPELFVSAFCTDNRAVERLWTKGGGGIIYDMGIYPIAMAQQFMGNPRTIEARGLVRPDGLDEESTVLLTYEAGGRAVLVTSGIASLPQRATCSLERGTVDVHAPFLAPSGVTVSTKEFYAESQSWRDESAVQGHEGLSYQATYFAKLVGEGQLESPVHSHADTVANIATAAEVSRQIGAKAY